MRVDETKRGDIAIISLIGNMVGTCEAELLHHEVRAFIKNKKNKIILDMKDVHWMGSLCIGAIMREIIAARQNHGDVYLASLTKKVRRLFKLTKLDNSVGIFPTVDAAVQEFNGKN